MSSTPASLPVCSIDRRAFLRLSLMSSAALLAASEPLAALAEETGSAVPSFATFRPLSPGAVRPEGWLRMYLEKQAAQLGSQLPNVSWPFTAPYWSGEEQGESWWPWEQKAYWIDGAMRLGLVLDDHRLLEQVGASIRYTLDHVEPDGYLGPHFTRDAHQDFHRWPHNILFRGIAAASDAGRYPGAAEALRRHYLNDGPVYGKPVRNVTNIENMLWVYERTGDKRLLATAEAAWQEYSRVSVPGGDGGDLGTLRVFAATPIDAHGVTYAEICKLPALLFLSTGKQEYLEFALAAQRRIFDHHMLIDGVPSTSEYFRTRTSLDSHETCDIADHTWSWGAMLMATGQGIWADRIERACFNGGMGALKKDWKALQYFSCPNQFLATLNSDHNVMEHGGRMMAFQPNPGQHTACCGGDVHRVFPNYTIRMWMRSADDGLAAMLYGPSRVRTTVTAARQEIEIVQRTGYPFEERIEFDVATARPVEFPLSLRIPSWCARARIEVNGKAVDAPVHNGFATLRRTFADGDKITLTLPMKAALTAWPQNGVGVEHGPLVYALAIQEKWAPVIEAKYTTAEFPSWNALPVSPWNYALALDPERLEQQLRLERRALRDSQDPWVEPPVRIFVPARTIAHWDLQQNPDDPAQQFTPPLPEVSSDKLGPVQELALVPYGSTHLRLTIFPDASRA